MEASVSPCDGANVLQSTEGEGGEGTRLVSPADGARPSVAVDDPWRGLAADTAWADDSWDMVESIQCLAHDFAFSNLTTNLYFATMLVGKRFAMKKLRYFVKRHKNAACGAFTRNEVHRLKLLVRSTEWQLPRRPYSLA